MNTFIALLIGVVVGALLALAVYIGVRRIILKGRKDEILEKAELEGENIKKEKILQAKEKFLQLKSEHEQYVSEKNAAIRDTENRLKQKENTLNQKNSELDKRLKDADNMKNSLQAQRENAQRKAEEYDRLKAEVNKQIEAVAGMTAQEAKNQLVENMKAEART